MNSLQMGIRRGAYIYLPRVCLYPSFTLSLRNLSVGMRVGTQGKVDSIKSEEHIVFTNWSVGVVKAKARCKKVNIEELNYGCM